MPPPRRGSLGALRRQVWDNLKREGGDQQQRRDFTPPTRLPARSLLHPAMLHERKSLSPPPRGTARSQLSRPPHSSTSQEAIDVNGFQRLSTEGLSPLQHHLRSSGTIEIVPSSSSTSLPSLLVDVRTRIGLVYLISGDGSKMSVFANTAPSAPLILLQPNEVYGREELPAKYEKVYALAFKFVEGVRSRLPKMVFYNRTFSLHIKHTIFSDSPPTYELALKPPFSVVVRVDRRRSVLIIRHVTTPDNGDLRHPLKLSLPPSPQAIKLLSREEQDLVRIALDRAQFVDRSVRAFDEASSRTALPLSSSKTSPTSATSPLRSRSVRTPRPSTPSPLSLELLTPQSSTQQTIAAISLAVSTPFVPRPPSRSYLSSSPPSTSSSFSIQQPTIQQDKRCLPGAGWIFKELLGPEEHPQLIYRALFSDGHELVVNPLEQKVLAKDHWHSIDGNLPMRVKMRLQIVGEMLALF